ncbi:MAG: glycoside hydrolase family 3 N-terminal domain-containing protein [Rhodothermales bacterium]|nr:glycoside hydrolase family 3 N-terminal domain-containing protein [Rhodothermales bacterium]
MNPPIVAHDDLGRISSILGRWPIGGVLLFNGVFAETGEAVSELQGVSRYPLLIAADMERGAGQQLRGATVFPHAMAFATRADSETLVDAREMGRITAREALAAGVNFVLGPVADLNRNPRNPIIGARAFGKEPSSVAALVAAYIEGCRSEGVLVSPKHFPGHGNTDADSHTDVPNITGSTDEFERFDLVPFRAAIEAGCDTIMTAHAAYPGLDPSGRVATSSMVILDDVLRTSLRFLGAAVSDSLLMEGVRKPYAGTGEMAVDLVRSGLDLLLDVDDVEAAVNAISQAVADGSLSRKRLEQAFDRSWSLKERLAAEHGREWPHALPPHPTEKQLASHLAVSRRIAERALADFGRPFVVRPDSSTAFVIVKPYRTHLEPEFEPFGRMVTESFGAEAYNQVGDDTPDDILDEIVRRTGSNDQLVVGAIVRPAAWRRFGLSDRLTRFVEKLLRSVDESLLLVLGAPDAVASISHHKPMLATFSDVEASQAAAFDRIVRT